MVIIRVLPRKRGRRGDGSFKGCDSERFLKVPVATDPAWQLSRDFGSAATRPAAEKDRSVHVIIKSDHTILVGESVGECVPCPNGGTKP